MAKEENKYFVLTLRMLPDKRQLDILDARMRIGKRIYNQCVRKTLAQYEEMKKTKRYRAICDELNAIKEERKANGDTDLKKKTPREKELYSLKNDILKEYGFTDFSMRALALQQSRAFSRHIDSTAAEDLGHRLWCAWEKVIYHTGEEIHYKKWFSFNSLSSKTNKSGITTRVNCTHPSWEGEKTAIIWGQTNKSINLAIPLDVNPKSDYEKEALTREVVRTAIVKGWYKGKPTYYAHITLKGAPPVKYDKSTGHLRHFLGEGEVEVHLTRTTATVTTKGNTTVYDLADRVEDIEQEVSAVEQALDRSKRATNPQNYNPDGTPKQAKKNQKLKFKRSNHYKKVDTAKKELNRKQKAVRTECHYKLANHIASLGNEFVIIHPNFKLEQQKHGKDIGKRAPSAFLTILTGKIEAKGGIVNTIIEE